MSIRRTIRSFLGRSDGAILAIVGVSITVFLGFVALSFDLGRVAATQSELQSFADHVALAAAGELDGASDAITRATAAANNLITDSQKFGSGGAVLDSADFVLTFHSTLPADDAAAMAGLTTDPAAAIFARVVVNQHTVDMPFGNALSIVTGAGAQTATPSAEAVAGFTQYACDVTALMFCIPGPSYRAEDHVGDSVILRSGGSASGAWQPGNFGFIDLSEAGIDEAGPCEGLNGQNLSRCLLGAEDFLTKCFAQRGVDTKPGQNVGSYEAAINVRFDMYQATMNGQKNDADYRPAPNVIKGVVPNSGSCVGNNPVDSPSEPLPEDTCFATGTCPYDRFGDGNWDRTTYITANHGGAYPPGTGSDSTRYAMYLAELAQANGVTAPAAFGGADPVFSGDAYLAYLQALMDADSNSAIISGAESGRPTCSSNRSPDPERRIVIAAGVDCTANPISGAANDVPVEEFFKIFLTKPAGVDSSDPSNFEMYGEIVGSAGGPGAGAPTSAGIFRDVVQLYR